MSEKIGHFMMSKNNAQSSPQRFPHKNELVLELLVDVRTRGTIGQHQ